jgi:hypothetical protein
MRARACDGDAEAVYARARQGAAVRQLPRGRPTSWFAEERACDPPVEARRGLSAILIIIRKP